MNIINERGYNIMEKIIERLNGLIILLKKRKRKALKRVEEIKNNVLKNKRISEMEKIEIEQIEFALKF
jgi:hypothetical protein